MIDARELRDALGHFATGVTVVTTLGLDRAHIGVTVNSFASLSLDPPLVLWSLAKRSWSLPAFQAANHFAIHVLAHDQQALSDRFAKAGHDKFAGVEVGQGLGGVPLLPGGTAVFQCSVEHRYDGGDHLILIGRVEALTTRRAAPLLFYRGRYATPEYEQPPVAGRLKFLLAA
ncbi:MAG: Nitrilotriacetate monooxygenase component B [Burkholderiaceae bacterium]|jgi:flavin reductase (DIM6/NTAB) family NADH-FMN oxidoreductase RutF|nr:MAG: Nitrilotriacetate monooxygenase component B [Burkholderiaceae bacterium]